MKMLVKLSMFLILLICLTSQAQTGNYQNLLDTAFKGHGSMFVHSKPLIVTKLDRREMWYYFENVVEYSNRKLDTVMFAQIIQNVKNGDTAIWTDNELPNFFLVKERDETISKKYALQKMRFTSAKQMRVVKKQVRIFNSTQMPDRNIFYFSRPVFDDSKTFAIVEWDNGHSYLFGGGGIVLYQLQSDNTWKESGVILNWSY